MGGGPDQGTITGVLKEALVKFKEWKPIAEAYDEQELQLTMQKPKKACSNNVYYSAIVQKSIGDLKAKLQEIDRILTTYLPKIIDMYEYLDELKQVVVPGWDKAITQLNEARGAMGSMAISDWRGAAGDSYRQHIAAQTRNIEKQIALAINARRSMQWLNCKQTSLSRQRRNGRKRTDW